MFGTFICKDCKHILDINFDNPDSVPRTCRNCGHKFISYNYLTDFAQKTSNLDIRLHDLELYSLGKYANNNVYNPKFKELQAMYSKSPNGVKKLLKAILEINYLVVEQATNRQEPEILSTYSEKLAEVIKEMSKMSLG